MRLIGALLLLLSAPGAAAEFDQALAAQVFAAAFDFMAPRMLEPVPAPQLALWGMHGLTALDPDLSTELVDGKVELANADRVLASRAVPAADDIAGWAATAATFAATASLASTAVQRAGMAGVISNFFDELFNHFDPYSRYVSPADAEADRARRLGAAGVGVTLARSGGALLVASVAADGPADAAGIRPGERLLAIDDDAVDPHGLRAAAARLAGAEETRIVLTLRGRDGRGRRVELQRALMPPETVTAERDGAMLVLHVSGFARNTGARLAHVIRDALISDARAARQKPRGLVLDLRGNRGGLLDQSVAVTGTVLGDGLVATTAGRDPAANRVLEAEGDDLSGGLPVVVVVDGRSASAAEIVAAALADNRRAVVVGSTTLGKGLLQTITELPDGGELFVTWSRVLAPLGWPIQGLGVMPQVCTSLGGEVLARQLASLGRGDLSMLEALQRNRTARPGLPAMAVLDIRAACPAAEGRDADLRAARYLIDNQAAYAAALLPAQLQPAASP